MAFFAGLITILAFSAVEPAPHPAPGFVVPARSMASPPATTARPSCDRYTAPEGPHFPVVPADPLGPFSEGEDDNRGEDLIEDGAKPFDDYPPRDDCTASRTLWAHNDQGPAAGRLLPRRC